MNSGNRDLDLFILDCGGEVSRCIAHSSSPTGSESITINNWSSQYRIVVDGYNAAQNGSYTLSVSCADPCKDIVNPQNNCSLISFAYQGGTSGNLRYLLTIPTTTPTGTWTATGSNGSTINRK